MGIRSICTFTRLRRLPTHLQHPEDHHKHTETGSSDRKAATLLDAQVFPDYKRGHVDRLAFCNTLDNPNMSSPRGWPSAFLARYVSHLHGMRRDMTPIGSSASALTESTGNAAATWAPTPAGCAPSPTHTYRDSIPCAQKCRI